MEIFNIDWAAFLGRLSAWGTLPREARREFLDKTGKPKSIKVTDFTKGLPLLESAGFLQRNPSNPRLTDVTEQSIEFRRVIRSMDRVRVLDDPDQSILLAYVREHYQKTDLHCFVGLSFQADPLAQRTAAKVVSFAWVNGFLQKKSTRKFEDASLHGSAVHIRTQAVFETLKRLVKIVKESPSPLPIRDLPNMVKEAKEKVLGEAIRAGLYYMLFFASLRDEDLEPTVGLHPVTAARVHHRSSPLESVHVAESCSFPFLMDDMTSVLVHAVRESIRLRGNDGLIFAKAAREITSTLKELPHPLDADPIYDRDGRLKNAVSVLEHFGFLSVKGTRGVNMCLAADSDGEQWLALPPKERLKAVYDRLSSKSRGQHHSYLPPLQLVPERFCWDVHRLGLDGADLLRRAFGSLDGKEFVRLSDYLEYHADGDMNPLIEMLHSGNSPLTTRYQSATEDEVKTFYKALLLSFVYDRLVPLGGCRFGVLDNGEIVFGLNDRGKYFLGLAEDFDHEHDETAEILVQPNFDVVFLSPSPIMEARLAKFCECIGKRVGHLFKITRASILEAAATGIDSEHVLTTLSAASRKEVPQNVEIDIKSWFAQCRDISVQRATLIRCPDIETAGRVVSAGGKHVELLTDTIVELKSKKEEPAILKKLRKMGIFPDDFRGRR